jgi:hypothetical protein
LNSLKLTARNTVHPRSLAGEVERELTSRIIFVPFARDKSMQNEYQYYDIYVYKSKNKFLIASKKVF